MMTFVIWAIGLYIMFHIAVFNLCMVAGAFAKNFLLGLLVLALSVIGWISLLAMIL